MMTLGQMIVAIVVALIGASAGAFAFVQFMIKRKDDKEEKASKEAIQKQIDESIDKAMGHFIAQCGEIGDIQISKAINEAKQEFNEGLTMRGEEGKERFEINSEQIKQNSNMIQEVLTIQKQTNEKFDKLAESLATLSDATAVNSKLTKACAEGIKSTNYDKILLVANKALKRGCITITEKTNLKQLYNSWTELNGSDPKITTYYEDCIALKTIPDEEGNL